MAVEAQVVVGVVLNVLTTVGIVLANKYIYDVVGFRFMVMLSCFHFITTAIGMRVMLALNMFKYKAASFSDVWPLCLGSLGSVAFMNLNLAHNSVGFYQVSKLVCIPFILLVEYQWYGKTVSGPVKQSLAVILLGVGIATVSDFQLNFLGSVFAAAAIGCTAMAQIFTTAKTAELGLDANQLLYHTSPYIAVGMAFLAPFFDDIFGWPHGLMYYEWTSSSFFWVLFTCVLSISVNISNYMVLGRTSPVTYQVVGHLKTCLILVWGFIVFNYPVDPRNLLGIVIAITGMVIYTEIKRREAPAARSKPVEMEKRTSDDNERLLDRTERGEKPSN